MAGHMCLASCCSVAQSVKDEKNIRKKVQNYEEKNFKIGVYFVVFSGVFYAAGGGSLRWAR